MHAAHLFDMINIVPNIIEIFQANGSRGMHNKYPKNLINERLLQKRKR